MMDENIMLASHLRNLAETLNLDPFQITVDDIISHLKYHPHKEKIIEQIRSQQRGIPYEYQFGAICWWLGKCKHLQFIDTKPDFPYLSKIKNIRYPDIYAIFRNKSTDFTCFIQIKVNNKLRLKLSKNYIESLKKYPLLKDYPLLIAWKCKEFWLLFDINTFITDKGNVNVEFGEAMKANLMSVLVGDFSFKGFKEGIECYYAIEPIDYSMDDIRTRKIKKFRGRLVDISISDPITGNTIPISAPIFYLLPYLGEWEPFERTTKSCIISGEQNKFQISLFAYQALIFGTLFQASIFNEYVNWKNILKSKKFIFSMEDIVMLIHEYRKKNMGFEYSLLKYKPSIKNPCLGDY